MPCRVTATDRPEPLSSHLGVGCIVDSCRHCYECDDGLENYCDHMIVTYNFPNADEPGHTLTGSTKAGRHLAMLATEGLKMHA